MAAPQSPPPALMGDVVEDCLLRLPPDDPASLVRAALVCKGWRRVVAERGFSRRFHKLHGRPLMLGYLHIHTRHGSFFTPTSSFRSGNAGLRIGGWHPIDSRHGRVLLSSSPSLQGTLHTRRRSDLAVWNPISGDHLDLPELLPPQHRYWFGYTSKAVVLCASTISACDHNDCHRGHFLVILVDATYGEVCVYVYSSRVGAWSHVTSVAQDSQLRLVPATPVAVVGNSVYIIVHKWSAIGILKYDMGAHDVSWVNVPRNVCRRNCRILFTTKQFGGLRTVLVEENSRIRRIDPSSGFFWWPDGATDLQRLLPANSGSISTVTFIHELGAFFIMTTTAGAFTVDLVLKSARKVRGNNRVDYFVP